MNVEKTTVELGSGEYVSLALYEIVRIPDISILKKDGETDSDVLKRQKRQMNSLFSEIHQGFRMKDANICPDSAIELLWLTQPAVNQTYSAEIKLYAVIRALDSDRELTCLTVDKISAYLENSLQIQKYEYINADVLKLSQELSEMDLERVNAIVKDAKWENLQNAILPMCLVFDRFSLEASDLEEIVFSLSRYPGCILSVQMIPAEYNSAEGVFVDNVAQGLTVLSRGVYSQGIGNVSFAAAEKNLDTYKYYSAKKDSPLFYYNILIAGRLEAVMEISARVLSFLKHGSMDLHLKSLGVSAEYIDFKNNFYPLPWAASEELQMTVGPGGPGGGGFNNGEIAANRLPLLITAEEGTDLFRLPVGSTNISAGLKINYAEKNTKTYNEQLINSGELDIGILQSSGKDMLGIQLDDLTKHLLVTGTPGSGKTTFLTGLLDQLWKQHKIPFLVIEPAKNEYRALINSIPDIQVFTPGKNFISPLLINPFLPPENVRLESYKSTLKTAFSASMSMASPLDKIFEETIHNCYADFHWLDSYTKDDGGPVFNIQDFIRCFEETFSEIGYTGDAMNIGRAGVVRLKGISRLFDHYDSISIGDLVSRPTIIELAAIENPEEKALIISLLLLSVLSYVNSNYLAQGTLKNVILLEEAHVLLDADTNVGEGNANPSLIAQNLIKRMLAELRSYGVGMVIADQSPRKVSQDVIALTDMKVSFRIVEKTDRDILADSINLDENRRQRLARLKPGEAFMFFQKLEEPEELRIRNYRDEHHIGITMSDEELARKCSYWKQLPGKMRPYPECAIHGCCGYSCDYELRLLGNEIARQVFRRYFRKHCTNMKELDQLWRKLRVFVEAELNGKPYSKRLMACVQVHLLRRIKYETRMGISDKTIQKTLEHFI